eukprot:438192_1
MALRITRYLLIMLFVCLFTSMIMAQDADKYDDHDHDEHDDHDDHDYHHDTHYTDMGAIWRALAITCFAGFAAFLGGFSIFCVKPDQIGVMSSALSFSAGLTIHLSLVTLIPECIALLSHSSDRSASLTQLYALFCVIGGILITFSMEVCFKHFGIDPHHDADHDSFNEISVTTSTATDIEENGLITMTSVTQLNIEESAEARPLKSFEKVQSQSEISELKCTAPCIQRAEDTADTVKAEPNENELNLSQTSYTVAFALILHHLPEGIATFVSLYHDLEFGILVAFALAVHDIPSGICISVPLYCATGSKTKPFILCGVAAVVYPIGGCIGWAIIETTTSEIFIDSFVGILMGVTGGIMLYISLVELMPTAIISAHNADKNQKHKHVLTKSICWMFVGLLVMIVSNIILVHVGGHVH